MKNLNKNLNTKPKFRVNHNCDDIPEALGISNERADELNASFATWLTTNPIDLSMHTRNFEILFNLADTIEEFCFLIWYYTRVTERIEKL